MFHFVNSPHFCESSDRKSYHARFCLRQRASVSLSVGSLKMLNRIAGRKKNGGRLAPVICRCFLAKLLIASAGRRNDSVHAQVFHHLSIMIKRVGHCKGSAEELGSLSLAERVRNKRQGRAL